MSRDPHKLKAFVLADELVVDVYRATTALPIEERFGLQAQLRRAAVSVPANLVEGCARRTLPDYLHFIGIANGSASEVRYLLRLTNRLGYLPASTTDALASRYGDLIRAPKGLMSALELRA
jgi:four helix bundle protein